VGCGWAGRYRGTSDRTPSARLERDARIADQVQSVSQSACCVGVWEAASTLEMLDCAKAEARLLGQFRLGKTGSLAPLPQQRSKRPLASGVPSLH